MNKKLFALGMIAVMLSTTFVSCKKGENDPFLSLRCRKARITGEWELTEAQWTTIVKNREESTHTTNASFDGSKLIEKWTQKVDDETFTDTYTTNYSEKIVIEKDGTFELKETSTVVGGEGSQFTTITKHEGYWQFLGKNKSEELKNKERVSFHVTKLTVIHPNGATDIENFDGHSRIANYTFLLDKLANKELVALLEESHTTENFASSTSGSKTYEKQK